MVAVSVPRFSKEPRSIEFHIEVKINRTDLVKKNLWVWEVGVQFFKRPGHLLSDFLGWHCMRDRWYFEEKLWTFKKKLKSPFFLLSFKRLHSMELFWFSKFFVLKNIQLSKRVVWSNFIFTIFSANVKYSHIFFINLAINKRTMAIKK